MNRDRDKRAPQRGGRAEQHHVVFNTAADEHGPTLPPRTPVPSRSNMAEPAYYRGDSDSDDTSQQAIISQNRTFSQGDIQVESPKHMYNTQDGAHVCAEHVCADRDHPDVVCSEQHKLTFGEIKDPRVWTIEDEIGAFSLLPSRTRHSSKRKKKPPQIQVDDPGPAIEDDIELQQISAPDLPSRHEPSRRSLRRTLRHRSQKSVKRSPQENMTIEERRTMRREELDQMDMFEVKNLPCCTRIGYELTLAIQRSWRKIHEGLRNFRIWGKAIREIECNLGSGVSTYFRVLRWLLMINFFNLFVAISLVTFPALYIAYTQLDGTETPHTYNADDLNCTNPNFLEPNTTLNNFTNYILQGLTGTGWMEKSPLYIGWYPSLNWTTDGIKFDSTGCIIKDVYKCFTYDNTSYDTSYAYPDSNSQYYNCSVNCMEEVTCALSCYQCKNSDCFEKLDDTIYFESTNQKYECYGLEDEATYGAGNCQFPDVVVNQTGLRCTGCRRPEVKYNFSLAYLLVGLSYFTLSLLLVGRNIMKLFKKSAVELVGYTPYSQLVLGGWDFNISNRQSAILKSKSILKSLKEELQSDSQKDRTFSTKEKVGLFSLRLFTNIICVGAMGLVIWLYYDVYDTIGTSVCSTESFTDEINFNTSDITNVISLDALNSIWDSYAPSIIVSASNVIFPVFFEFVGNMERHQFQSTRINITMARSYIMKLFSIISYMYILRETVKSSAQLSETSDDADDGSFTYNCWEDYIGTELYRLVMIDFVMFCMVLLMSEYGRRFMVDHNRFVKNKFNLTEFNISKEVLDICYKQMIFWAAVFFCPLISVVAFIEIILIFYLKKHSALNNVRPPEKVILNSSNSSIINLVFICSLLVVFFLVGLIIFTFVPSALCGPFQSHGSFIEPLNVMVDKTGAFKTLVLDNLKLTSLIVVLAVMTIIIIYYFYSLAASRNITIHLLREQIKVENADKKFLIEQLKSGNRPDSSTTVLENDIAKSRSAVIKGKQTGKNKKAGKKKAIGTYANPNVNLRR